MIEIVYMSLTIVVQERKANKPQPRVKIGGATRGPRVTFREREPTRRRGPVRGTENKVA